MDWGQLKAQERPLPSGGDWRDPCVNERGRCPVSKKAAAPLQRPKRRGANVYLAGAVIGQACALLRYTLLARLLGPRQLGLVATLILVSNFFELVSDTGSDRFLVQDPDGDEPA